jgi:hypothetical protein
MVYNSRCSEWFTQRRSPTICWQWWWCACKTGTSHHFTWKKLFHLYYRLYYIFCSTSYSYTRLRLFIRCYVNRESQFSLFSLFSLQHIDSVSILCQFFLMDCNFRIKYISFYSFSLWNLRSFLHYSYHNHLASFIISEMVFDCDIFQNLSTVNVRLDNNTIY